MIISASQPAESDDARIPYLEWEDTGCPLCGQRQSELLIEAADSRTDGSGLWFAVVQCQNCGLCFTNPRPTAATLAQFYPASYEPHRSPKRLRNTQASRLRGWGNVRELRKSLPWHGERRLLDFGCGGGSYLARMCKQGWRVTGLDVSETAVRRVRTELRLPALQGTLPHADLRPCSFDVITMWQSLEHVHEPLKTLREAFRLLAPGGKLIVAVPNIDSLPFCWFGRSWLGLDLPRHLTHFAPWTLTLMLQRAGFHVGPIRMLRHSEWVRASARRAAKLRNAASWQRLLCVKAFARVASCYSALSQQSDCILAVAEK